MPLKHSKHLKRKSQINTTCLESQRAAGGKPVGHLESVTSEFTIGPPKINLTSERVERLRYRTLFLWHYFVVRVAYWNMEIAVTI